MPYESLPSAVPRGVGPPCPAGTVRWQVFGLVGSARLSPGRL